MVGTSPDTHGGISSVVNAWRAGGLFGRWPIDYVTTHCDGSRWDKLRCAVTGLAVMSGLAVRHRDVLVHVHGASRASFWRKAVCMAIAMLAGWRYVFHLHGGGFARFHEKECSPLGRAIVRFFLRRAAAIVVVSGRWATWVRSAIGHPHVVVVPNPVAAGATPIERENALVAFVGRCEAGKGIVDLLDAIARLTREVPGVRLECAGDGNLQAVRREAERMGIGDRVILSGWMTGVERDALLARATVFALPSHVEGLPMSLLEAMGASCPVVASAVGGIPDVVMHGVNGLLVPPQAPLILAGALRRILTDRGLAARLGAEARTTIERGHSVQRSLEILEQLYAWLGERRGTARARPSTRRLQETS